MEKFISLAGMVRNSIGVTEPWSMFLDARQITVVIREGNTLKIYIGVDNYTFVNFANTEDAEKAYDAIVRVKKTT